MFLKRVLPLEMNYIADWLYLRFSGYSLNSLRFSSAPKIRITAYNDKIDLIFNDPFSTVTLRVRDPEIQND